MTIEDCRLKIEEEKRKSGCKIQDAG